MSYFSELKLAMAVLADHENVLFLGQGVGVDGTTMSATFADVPANKRIEMPVAEDLQCGVAIGLALDGFTPVCVYPRWNFMLCAANQIVNHLDRIPVYSWYNPKVIIRVATPSIRPFYPGQQHDDDLQVAFKKMLRSVDVVGLTSEEDIVPAYCRALSSPRSTIVVEHTSLYNEDIANVRS